ncbi:MAG: Secreted beta-glucosidase sun1 [Sarea resinae]|nr:MAG: Secreted beta-glucosidase sun1 [Sarea resinae]
MKFSIALTLATAGALAAAQPHGHHHHRHPEKRQADVTVDIAGATTVVYVDQAGQTISPSDISDGKYIEVNGALVEAATATASQAASSASPSPTATSSAAAEFFQASSSSGSSTSWSSATSTSWSSATSATSSAAASSSSSAASSASASGSSSSSSSGSGNVDAEFPDGELDCSTFPSDYGAVPVDWMNLGGWTGVQNPTFSSDGTQVTDISTGTSGGCEEGAFCSYACPAGYQKSQWPSTQGATGQSVGGLQCKGGKLHLTNSALSKNICIQGTGNVNVQNKLGQNVAVCRTDYPGTESETVPLNTEAGQSYPLTCPDGNNYFKWNNADTSAQYYVNPKGVAQEKACTWGSSADNYGNWAPLNLGVGTVNGATWISIMQNLPTTDAPLDFDVEIVGDNLGGSCKYSSGKFYNANGEIANGCTVSYS